MVLFTALILSACKKQWDQRDKVTDQKLNINLMGQIKANASLSVFAGYLTQVGYDKLLSGNKTYTVWAPTNDALQSLDTSITNHKDKLTRFVANHIANQTYLTNNIQSSLRLRTLSGKNVIFTPTTVEDANITTANQYVSNGVLDIIDKPLTPKLNISEYVRGLTDVGLLQKAYIISRDSTYIDTTLASVDHIDGNGKPVLVPNTGVVSLNNYFKKVASLDNEDSTYTYFVLADNGYTNQTNRLKPYYKTSSVDTTARLAAFHTLKDVVVRGKLSQAQIATALKSVFGTTIPGISTSNIVRSYDASNGMVYVVNDINFDMTEKIPSITIQAELPLFYTRTDKTGNTSIRYLVDNKGIPYVDLMIRNSGVAAFFAAYKLPSLNTCEYKVIYRAINDTLVTHAPQPTGNISERIAFGPITGRTVTAGTTAVKLGVTFAYFNVTPYFYDEKEATTPTATAGYTVGVSNGRLSVLKYNSLYMYVQAANSTTTNAHTLLMDYVKLIPVLQ